MPKSYTQVYSTQPQTIQPNQAVEFENTVDIKGFTKISSDTLQASNGGYYLVDYAVLLTYNVDYPPSPAHAAFGIEINGVAQSESFFGQGFSRIPIIANIPAIPPVILYIPKNAKIRLINISPSTVLLNDDVISVSVTTASLTLNSVS